jgi:hypothetical protein
MTSHDSNAPRFHKPASHFQSHFFAQSSGNFMPPLESSCSSLPLYFHAFHCPFLPPFPFFSFPFLLSLRPMPSSREVNVD